MRWIWEYRNWHPRILCQLNSVLLLLCKHRLATIAARKIGFCTAWAKRPTFGFTLSNLVRRHTLGSAFGIAHVYFAFESGLA